MIILQLQEWKEYSILLVMVSNESNKKKDIPRKGPLSSFRSKIFIGILLTTPILVTIWIFNFLLKATTSWFPKRLIPYLGEIYNGYLVQFIVLLMVIFFFYILGSMAHHFFGKQLLRLTDKIFSNIPFVRNIYIFLRQVCEWVARSRNTMFKSAVLIEYPRKGCYAIGFVTAKTQTSIQSKIEEHEGKENPCASIFIPTTPNPTTGMYLILPEKDLIHLDIDVTEAINLIISAGVILSKPEEENKDSLLQMIDALVDHEKKNAD